MDVNEAIYPGFIFTFTKPYCVLIHTIVGYTFLYPFLKITYLVYCPCD